MHNIIGHHLLPIVQQWSTTIAAGQFLCFFVRCSGISLWPAWVSCPDSVLSYRFLHPQPPHRQGNEIS